MKAFGRNAFIFDGVRTPFGRHGGALASVRPDDLMAHAVVSLLQRTKVAPNAVDDVLVGCANQAGEDARNLGRHAALLAGLPETTPGATINRLCGSGLAALADAARTVGCGEADLVIAGGVESMTRAPFVTAKSERAFSREVRTYDSGVGSRFPNPRIRDRYGDDTNAEVADIIASEFRISRDEADRFALQSQQRYRRANDSGYFSDEMVALSAPSGRGVITVSGDEHPRPETSLEALQRLKTIHPNGTVTAGNASGINDGASALLVGAQTAAAPLRARARILGTAVCGVAPRLFGMGPVPATQKLLERLGLALSEIDVIEINEAFAAQVVACLRSLGVAPDDDRVNPNGGAIAIGHPLGASGARLALTALRELERRGGRFALITLCIGVGQGIATVLERC